MARDEWERDLPQVANQLPVMRYLQLPRFQRRGDPRGRGTPETAPFVPATFVDVGGAIHIESFMRTLVGVGRENIQGET